MSVITFPTLTVVANTTQPGLKSNTQVAVSDLSGYVQTRELPGARWSQGFRLPGLERVNAAKVESFLAQLRGQANRARVPLWARGVARGTWAGSPKVNNEYGSPTLIQTGNTLQCNGFAANATVKEGDYFNIGAAGELKICTQDGTADGSGNLLITFEPNMRASPAHLTALVSSNVVIPYMILTDPHAKWAINPHSKVGGLSDFAFDLIEVFG